MSLDETALLQSTDAGLYCPAGGFHVDPWRPVDRAIVTHAHADHACWGCGHYLTSQEGRTVLRTRVGDGANVETLAYGEPIDMSGVRVSLHPAGHVLGSAQVRVEHRGEVWVVSGDYKTEPDLTCAPFEVVRCHTFISECTFGLPVYRWQEQQMAYDLIEHASADIRSWPPDRRREALAAVIAGVEREFPLLASRLRLSPLVDAASWDDLARARTASREREAEGLMIKLSSDAT